MTYAINYQGLRQRQTYDELVDYLLDKQPKIIYPDRRATFIRNSPQLSNLLDGDGLGAVFWEEQQINRMKEEQKEHAIREAGGTAQHLRAAPQNKSETLLERYSIADDDYDKRRDDFNDQLESVTSSEQEKEQKKEQDNLQMVQSHLSEVRDQQSGVLLGAENLIKSSSSSSGNGDTSSETFHSLPPTEQQQVYPFPFPSEQQSSSSPARDPTASSSTSRNPQEPRPKGRPKGSTNKPKPDTDAPAVYPSLEHPQAMNPMIEYNNEKDLLEQLFKMSDEELKSYAINNLGLKVRRNISTEALLGQIIKAQLGPPSAPTLKLINAESKRRKRIDTPKPLRSPM